MKIGYILPIILLFIFLWVPTAGAALFDVNLGLNVYGSYDDNIRLLSSSEISQSTTRNHDDVLQIRPSIKVGFQGTRSSFQLNYELFKEWYSSYRPSSGTPSSYHDGFFKGDYELTNRISFGLIDSYKDTLYGTTQVEIPEFRNDYTSNQFSPWIQYSDSDGKWAITLNNAWSYTKYTQQSVSQDDIDYGFADWDELETSANFRLSLLTRTDLLMNTSMWSRSYVDERVAYSADQSGYYLSGGAVQRLGEGITVQVMAQYNFREYDTAFPGEANSFSGMGGVVSIVDQFSTITSLEIEGYSQFSGSEKVAKAFFRDTGFKTTFHTVFSKRIETSVKLSYSTLDYQNVDEDWKDKYFQSGMDIGYKVAKWLSVKAKYNYSKRVSDAGRGEFENNLVSVYLQFRHDLFF